MIDFYNSKKLLVRNDKKFFYYVDKKLKNIRYSILIKSLKGVLKLNHSIEIKNLNKFYGRKQVLFNINLSIEQGMFGLLGRNGAGKTTLMKTLATLLQKKDGSITIYGIPIENEKEIREIIGYLPQEFSMYPSMNILETMDYLAILAGLKKQERKERIEILLRKVNLMEHKNKKVKALSGGMKRRLGIAQALLNNPKVLIVDEPTAGLDPEERIRFRNLLSEIAEDRIVILSTHIVGDIEATCENIAILNDGKVLYHGTVNNLLAAADGKVFTKIVSRQELPKLKNELFITSMHTQGKNVYIRFISENEVSGMNVCEPNIEDAYMLYLKENGTQLLPLSIEEMGGEN